MHSGTTKPCAVCGEPLRSARQTYHLKCREDKLKTEYRKRVRDRHDLHFIGVDGEGVNRPDGVHEYIMLSVGDNTLHDDGNKLSLVSILEFLWQCKLDNPKGTVFVGFFLGYDFGQWFRMLPEERARLLYSPDKRQGQRRSGKRYPDPVVYEGWEIDIMNNRRFKLHPHQHVKSRYYTTCVNRTCGYDFGSRPGPDRTPQSPMYICDTGSFWQTSFLDAINPANWAGEIVCTNKEFQIISEGKEDRGTVVEYGDSSYLDKMARYNVLENDILARITERLNRGFVDNDISIRLRGTQWFGPGQAAEAWMRMIDKRLTGTARKPLLEITKESRAKANLGGIISDDIYHTVPSWFREAAQSSYYGGWFEIPMHGHVGTLYEYDINSAYPAVINTLPCLHTHGKHTGRYSQGTGDSYPSMGYTLLHCTIRGSDRYLGSMPYRDSKGRILRPTALKGWYWKHEVEAASRAGLIDTLDVDQWCHYEPCHCSPPFAMDDIGIRRMYNLRLQVGKNTPAGKGLKLVYNSAYGKTAQSIGSPKFSNPIYASLITAGCRTLILDAIATHPERSKGVAMVATDGIYFTSPHPHLPLSKTELGKWDHAVKHDMTLLMPGVYWDRESRKRLREGKHPKLKSRGINVRDLASQIDVIDGEFEIMKLGIDGTSQTVWPTFDITVRMMITTPQLALHRGKWEQAGEVLTNKIRRVSADPIAKRDSMQTYVDDGIIRTTPHHVPDDRIMESMPYDKSFGYIDPEDDAHNYMTPEGMTVESIVSAMLN